MEDVRVAFGRRVRDLRHRLGLSQEELAERARLHWTYVGGIERGERNLSLVNIARLATALGLSLADLFEPFRDVRRWGVGEPTGRRKTAARRVAQKPRRVRPTKG